MSEVPIGVGIRASAWHTAVKARPTTPADAVCAGYSLRRTRENQNVTGINDMP
jgi:hypothetical protein